MRQTALFVLFILTLISCKEVDKIYDDNKKQSNLDIYWENLQKLCGQSFEGTLTYPKEDSNFSGKKLIMHFRKCDKNQIKIPFIVGEDQSRTWILTKKNGRLELKHDHRHQDGTPETITMYGGTASNVGFSDTQIFPADAQTTEMLPAAASNVWWISISDSTFTYNLRRIGTDRLFTVSFDLTKPISNPEAPWGWVE